MRPLVTVEFSDWSVIIMRGVLTGVDCCRAGIQY